jgi:hypothetical protein
MVTEDILPEDQCHLFGEGSGADGDGGDNDGHFRVKQSLADKGLGLGNRPKSYRVQFHIRIYIFINNRPTRL